MSGFKGEGMSLIAVVSCVECRCCCSSGSFPPGFYTSHGEPIARAAASLELLPASVAVSSDGVEQL